MAYKRYFNKNGKRLGPYYYESYRDENGKVKKRYVGTTDPSEIKESLVKTDSVGVTPTGSKSKLVILGVLVFALLITDLSVILML